MKPVNQLAENLRAGRVVFGLGNMYPASGIIEGMCAGWDFVWIDAQHGLFSRDSVLAAMQAAGHVGVDVLLRVPGAEYGIVGTFADFAPAAIMIPMVDTPEQARAVVTATRFPPLGKRSFGGRRVIDLYGRDYYKEREMIVVAQIETKEAVENVDAICATKGIDMVFFGPDDMKVQMDIPVSESVLTSKPLRQAMQRTSEAARKAGKWVGSVAVGDAQIKLATELGYQLLAVGADAAYLRMAAAQRLAELKKLPGSAPVAPRAAATPATLYGG